MREIIGTISKVRAVEDCIRATKKYTEGIFTNRKEHPIQGNGFASKVFCRYYEVYPDMEAPSWEMKVKDLWRWLDTQAIIIKFFYDYRVNKASIKIDMNGKGIGKLEEAIPGLKEIIGNVQIE